MTSGYYATASPYRNHQLVVEGIFFYVNASSMAECSLYFEKMFFSDGVASNNKVFPLECVSANDFKELLDVLGMNRCELRKDVNIHNFPTVIRFAKEWSIGELRTRCVMYIKDWLTYSMPNFDMDLAILKACCKYKFDGLPLGPAIERMAFHGVEKLMKKKVKEQLSDPDASVALFSAAGAPDVTVARSHRQTPLKTSTCSVMYCDKSFSWMCTACGLFFCAHHNTIDCVKSSKPLEVLDQKEMDKRSDTRPHIKILPMNHAFRNVFKGML